MAEIEAINLRQGKALLDDGQVIPITTMMDSEGEDTLCPRAAKAIVAGPCKDGRWYADMTSIFDQRATVN